MTTKTNEAEWQAQMAQQGASVPEGYSKEGDIISPSGDSPVAMRISQLQFKGYVEVWDTQTGVMSLQPQWLLWQTMRKTRPDGSLVFTLTNPHIAPNHGEDLFCPLNPASPEYKVLQRMGFRSCRKRHIPHQDARMRHTRKSHARAYDVLEQVRVDRIREEDRALQVDAIRANQQVLEALAGKVALPGTEERPLYVSDKPAKVRKPRASRR